MIDLYAKPNRQGYGIAMALSAERIPFRIINGTERDESHLLVIAAPELPHAVAVRAQRARTLVIGALPKVLEARFADAGPENLVRDGECHWWRTPIGEMLTGWVREENITQVVQDGPHLFSTMESHLPAWARLRMRSRQHQRLQKGLWSQSDPSSYPVDVSGLLQLELLKTAIRQAAGFLVRVERWPAGCRAAAVITHDLEDPRTAENGLRFVLGLQKRERQPISLGFDPASDVQVPSDTLRDSEFYALADLASGNGDNMFWLRELRERLERTLSRRVLGFRSRGLQRHALRAQWLDHSGFVYSSTMPDVDRETASHFGGGTRWNLPFRPPINDGYDLRESRCLEIPVSAPSCVEPLFSGASVDELRQAVTAKLEFLCETGGIFNGLSRSGSFGLADSHRRHTHLRWMVSQVRQHKGFWLTSLDQAATWWRRREQVVLAQDASGWVAGNQGSDTVAGLRVIGEDASGKVLVQEDVPALAPGASAQLRFDSAFLSEGFDREVAIRH
jgi:hypothetical protein